MHSSSGYSLVHTCSRAGAYSELARAHMQACRRSGLLRSQWLQSAHGGALRPFEEVGLDQTALLGQVPARIHPSGCARGVCLRARCAAVLVRDGWAAAAACGWAAAAAACGRACVRACVRACLCVCARKHALRGRGGVGGPGVQRGHRVGTRMPQRRRSTRHDPPAASHARNESAYVYVCARECERERVRVCEWVCACGFISGRMPVSVAWGRPIE